MSKAYQLPVLSVELSREKAIYNLTQKVFSVISQGLLKG